MTEKHFKLKIIGDVDNPIEIILNDNGQPLAQFLNLEEARLVRNILNEQEERIKELEKENDKLKFENNELKCALALDGMDYIIASGKKIDIPPYYEFEQRYDSVMHRREYDGYD